ncbi:hypothetical protein HYQ37_gp001 [Salmonella phage pertopsoe]|uniref:Uncharacterized protein n=1 Tax=Salmonella phage pertopsoe TaxID=2713310 RepID=A0A6G8RPA2_9CAUD|nr:hypothetical protein HYQ37_gp001 [Salmonella phage pertopsoe]QIO03206.1 hypothetical protein pertopsoe_1 [Salmonella phage pertopsoe]
MHINTAIMKHVIPLLEMYEGKKVHKVDFKLITSEILRLTKKGVNFRRVLSDAVDLAKHDLIMSNTFSFNIDATATLVSELTQSSQARRDRFRHLCVPNDNPSTRVGIKLGAIRSEECFTVNYILEPESQRIYFGAIIGFYGNSINGWAERVGLKETLNKHSTPSTHYISRDAAREYVYLLERDVKLKVIK